MCAGANGGASLKNVDSVASKAVAHIACMQLARCASLLLLFFVHAIAAGLAAYFGQSVFSVHFSCAFVLPVSLFLKVERLTVTRSQRWILPSPPQQGDQASAREELPMFGQETSVENAMMSYRVRPR